MSEASEPNATRGLQDAQERVPGWTLAVITWINSLGSGLLWSGVPFVTESQYGFTERQNLLLALAESIIYVGVALGAGPLLRRLVRRGGSARAWLAWVFVGQMVGSMLVFLGEWGVVAAACTLSAVGASAWPVLESYLSSGRHGHDMRRAIGWFNVTWMSATGAALLLMGPILAAGHAQHTLLVLVPVSLASLVLLRWFPRQPAAHSSEEGARHVPPSYRGLRLAMRFILPVSYVFIAVIGPILPFRLAEIELDMAERTPLASLWMFARMATVVGLAFLPFWHGRWSVIGAGVALLAGGFAAMVLATDVGTMAAGLAAFGAGHGILYYAGLYYAMAVGGAEVDAGGVFEALIGVGYVVGPVAGLAAAGTASTLIVTVWSVAAVGMLPALWAWRRSVRAPRTAP